MNKVNDIIFQTNQRNIIGQLKQLRKPRLISARKIEQTQSIFKKLIHL